MVRPSVVFINRVYPPVRGATGRVLRDLARAFAREGWEVTVVTTGQRAKTGADGPVKVVRVASRMRGRTIHGYLGAWLGLYLAALRLPRHDLVVTMTDPPLLAVAGRLLAKAKKSRHIHWCQDLYPDLLPYLGMRLPPFAMKFFKSLARRAMRECDKVVAVGRCMARQLVHAGIDPRRVAVIPNWPDAELVSPSRSAGRRPVPVINTIQGARPYESLHKDDGSPKFRVLYAGNLGRAHPLETILGAAQILDPLHPEIEFVFVGDGQGFERLARERTKRGLENLRLIPYQPAGRLRDVMESGDLHLITMKHEVEGMVVPCKLYSALAAGRPCLLIGPGGSEAGRVIRDFGAGDVVPQGDPRRLAQAILRYRMNGEDWFRAHEGARKAGGIFVPRESIGAWIARARQVVERQDRQPEPQGKKAA